MSELGRAQMWDKACGSVPVEGQDLSHPYVELSVNLIEEELAELQEAMKEQDVTEVVDACGDLLKVVSQLCYALNIKAEELLEEINDSNYSKFCCTEEKARESVERYKNDERYFGVHYVEVDVGFVIKGWKTGQNKNTATPKVLKGVGYFPPDLSRFVKGV